MTIHRIRIAAPTATALQLVTALADADGIDLVSSGHPSTIGEQLVELHVEVEASQAAVESAISDISAGLAIGASISLSDD